MSLFSQQNDAQFFLNELRFASSFPANVDCRALLNQTMICAGYLTSFPTLDLHSRPQPRLLFKLIGSSFWFASTVMTNLDFMLLTPAQFWFATYGPQILFRRIRSWKFGFATTAVAKFRSQAFLYQMSDLKVIRGRCGFAVSCNSKLEFANTFDASFGV